MNFNEAAQLISQSNRITGFTGAGISTESGIPDFRSPNGVWANNRMIQYHEFMANRDDRKEYWRQKSEIWRGMRDVEPNAGHKAFSDLESKGKLLAVITQNIDGLHQRAGSSSDKIIELHGTSTAAYCVQCNSSLTMNEVVEKVEGGDAEPRCEPCGGILKPKIVMFGESMPQNAMQKAYEASVNCEVFIVAGSSLVVYPAAGFPEVAKRNGAALIIINREATPLDYLADLVVNDEIGKTLPTLIQIF